MQEAKVETKVNNNQLKNNNKKLNNNNENKHIVKENFNSLLLAERVKHFSGGSQLFVVLVLGLAGIVTGKSVKFSYKGVNVVVS